MKIPQNQADWRKMYNEALHTVGVYASDEWVPPTDEEREMFRKIATQNHPCGEFCWWTYQAGYDVSEEKEIAESLAMDGL